MPYPNYHAARVQDPDGFEKLGTKKIADGILIISGRLTGESKTSIQAYRFDKDVFTATEAKAWLKEHKIDTTAFEEATNTTSTITSTTDTKPEIKGNSITIPFVKDGTVSFNRKKEKFVVSKEALDNSFDTWIGGIVTVNHKFKERGIISSVWRDGEFVYGTLDGLSDGAIEVINSPAYRGVSQESITVKADGNRVTKLRGTGITLVVYPETPACKLNDGCGTLTSSIGIDSAVYEQYDIGTINNTGTLIKTGEISIYVSEDEPITDDERKTRFAREVGWLGLGNYKIFEHDENLNTGDEIDSEIEPLHTVTINVSNIPLNTSETKNGISSTQQSRGTKSMSKETDDALEVLQTEVKTLRTQSTALTSEMAEHKTQLEKKDVEIATLTSTISDKDTEIAKAKDGVGAQITSALEAHDASRLEQTTLETAKADLKAVMSKDETYDNFMASEPSLAVIQSTITALKDALPAHQVGSGVGNEITSTDADVKTLDELGIPSVEFK